MLLRQASIEVKSSLSAKAIGPPGPRVTSRGCTHAGPRTFAMASQVVAAMDRVLQLSEAVAALTLLAARLPGVRRQSRPDAHQPMQLLGLRPQRWESDALVLAAPPGAEQLWRAPRLAELVLSLAAPLALEGALRQHARGARAPLNP